MNFDYTYHLQTIPLQLEAKAVFQNLACGTNRAIFTRINRYGITHLVRTQFFSEKLIFLTSQCVGKKYQFFRDFLYQIFETSYIAACSHPFVKDLEQLHSFK